jgi:hypothetical protein
MGLRVSTVPAGRWKYKTATVTVDGNSQTVRMLTAGERRQFAEMSAKKKAGDVTGTEMANAVLAFGTVEPTLSIEEIEAMPPDLYEACTNKIMELTGLRQTSAQAGVDGAEKKAPTEAQLNS